MNKHYEILKKAAYTVFASIAELGGERSNFFHDVIGNPDDPNPSTFRLIKYPKRDPASIPKKAILENGKSEAHK